MSDQKKTIRRRFRDTVFKCAGFRCQGPGCTVISSPEHAEQHLDAHHITPREQLPAGGYVAANGIALCRRAGGCHEKAEAVLQGDARPELAAFMPENLYRIINSSPELARRASEMLERLS